MLANSQKLKRLIIIGIVLIMSTMACAIDFGNNAEEMDVSVQQTLVALQMTQTALENQAVEIQTEPNPQHEDTPTVTAPIEENTEEPPDMLYEGIAFSFDPNITQNVIPTTIQGQDMGEDYMPGDTYPTHYEFTFNNYAVGDHFHKAKILIFPVDEYRAISPQAADIIDKLKQSLITKPGSGPMSDLPFLPMWPAAQIFSARVEYLDFQNGSGVRYLTMYGQALYPVDNQNLFYTYQGITHDSRYYIAAVLPVTHSGMPDEGQVDDWSEFESNWDSYIADTLTWLEAQDPNMFFPDLENLDVMMASFEINH